MVSDRLSVGLLLSCMAVVLLGLVSGSVVAQSNISSVQRSDDKVLEGLKFGERGFVADSSHGFVVSYLYVDVGKSQIRLVTSQDLSAGGSSIARFMYDERAIAVMNGGFLESSAPATPAGLLQINRRIINNPKLDPVMDGLLCFGGQGIQKLLIAPSSAIQTALSRYADCIQAGPVLAYEGKPLSNLQSLDENPQLGNFAAIKATRSFVAVKKNGLAMLAISTPVSLYDLQAALLLSEEKGGFEVDKAVALTGSNTAGLVVGDVKNFARGLTNVLLSNAIVVNAIVVKD